MAERLNTQVASDVINKQDDVTLRPKGRYVGGGGIAQPPVVTPPNISCTGATTSLLIRMDLQYFTVEEEGGNDSANAILWRVEVDGVLRPNQMGFNNGTWSYMEEYLENNQSSLGITGSYSDGGESGSSGLLISHFNGGNRRVRLIPNRIDWSKDPGLLNFVNNPTASFDPATKVVSFCLLADDGTGPIDPEPIDGLVPDFAVFAKNVTGNLSDNLGNSFNGALRTLATSPMEGLQATMMGIVVEDAIIASFDTIAQCVHCNLGGQVLAGDYIETQSKIVWNDSDWYARTSQFPVLGTDVEQGYIQIPFKDCLSGTPTNAELRITLTVKRGRVASNTVVIGTPVTLSDIGAYKNADIGDRYTRFLSNGFMYQFCNVAPDGTGTTQNTLLMEYDADTMAITELQPDPLYHRRDEKFKYIDDWSYQVQSSSSGGSGAEIRLTNMISGETREITLPVPWNTYETWMAYPNFEWLMLPDASVVYAIRRTGDNTSYVFYKAVWDGTGYVNHNGLPYPPTDDLTNYNITLTEGLTYGNGYDSMYVSGEKYYAIGGLGQVPRLYDITQRNANGFHTLAVDASQASLVEVLTKYKLIGQTNPNAALTQYRFKAFRTANFIMAIPFSNVPEYNPDLLLFKRTGNTWNLFKIIRAKGTGAKNVPNYFTEDQIVYMPYTNYYNFITSPDDKFMILYPTNYTDLRFKSEGSALRLQVINLGTGEVTETAIPESNMGNS